MLVRDDEQERERLRTLTDKASLTAAERDERRVLELRLSRQVGNFLMVRA